MNIIRLKHTKIEELMKETNILNNDNFFTDCNYLSVSIDLKKISLFRALLTAALTACLDANNDEIILILSPFIKINNSNIEKSMLKRLSFLFEEGGAGNNIIIADDFAFLAFKNNKASIRRKITSLLDYTEDNLANIIDFETCAAKEFLTTQKFFGEMQLKEIQLKTKVEIYFNEFKEFDKLFEHIYKPDLTIDAIFANLYHNLVQPSSYPMEEFYCNDFCITSLYTENLSAEGEYFRASLAEYCRKNKISYKIYDKPLMDRMDGNWSKALIILSQLQIYKKVMWVDADVMFTNKEISFKEFAKNINKVILFKDPSQEHLFNSGVMIFDKSSYSESKLLEFQQRIMGIQEANGRARTRVYDFGGDQGVLKNILSYEESSHEIAKGANIVILPEKLGNSHPKNWSYGDPIMHMMGYSKYRLKYMSYIYNKFKG